MRTAKITLKKGQPKSVEITVGNKTIKATTRKHVEVPLEDLAEWLATDRFEVVDETSGANSDPSLKTGSDEGTKLNPDEGKKEDSSGEEE